MATFVHNEPTCLNVLQEAGLPEAFYQVVESGIEPIIEVGYALVVHMFNYLHVSTPVVDELRAQLTANIRHRQHFRSDVLVTFHPPMKFTVKACLHQSILASCS